MADDQIHASSAHYFRIAGAASLFAFSLGYHPQLVTGIGRHLSRLDDHAPRPGAGSSTFPG